MSDSRREISIICLIRRLDYNETVKINHTLLPKCRMSSANFQVLKGDFLKLSHYIQCEVMLGLTTTDLPLSLIRTVHYLAHSSSWVQHNTDMNP